MMAVLNCIIYNEYIALISQICSKNDGASFVFLIQIIGSNGPNASKLSIK